MPEQKALNLMSFEEFERENQNLSRDEYKRRYNSVFLMSALVYNSPTLSSEDMELLELGHFFVRDGWFRVLSFKWEGTLEDRPENCGPGQWLSYKNYLLSQTMDYYIGRHYSVYSSEFGGRLICIVCLMRGETSTMVQNINQRINESIKKVVDTCSRDYDMKVECFSSSFCSSVNMLAMAYSQAMEEENLSRFTSKRIHSDNFDSASDFRTEWRNAGNIQQLSQALVDACQRQDSDKYFHTLDDLLNVIVYAPFCTMDRLHHRIISALQEVLSLLKQENILRINEARREEIALNIINAEGEDGLYNAARTYARQIFELYGKQIRKNSKGKYEQVLEYKNENSADVSLNLENIAANFGSNANALSAGFKRIYGMSVADCINTRRVELAKKALRDPETSLENVASSSGFGSVNTMYRIFKKYLGVTPGAFRDSALGIRKENEK